MLCPVASDSQEPSAENTLWWYRIVPYRSIVQGWKISPSHYLNQDLAMVWLAQ